MLIKKPKQLILTSLASGILATLSLQSAHAAYDFTKPIERAFKLNQEDAKYGQFKANLSYRYELADTKNATKTAHANTLRLRFGYLTPVFHGIQGFVEYEGNVAMQADYKTKGAWNGDATRNVVADPQDQELNQFWLSYKGFNTLVKGGRQRIIITDSRYIGNVGWRQLEQTFDAITVTNTSIENMTIKAGYIGQIQNIFSQDIDIDAPFLHINYKFHENASLSAYSYLISYENAAAASSKTFGLKVKGSPKINSDLKLHYVAEYANQSQYANNPTGFNLNRFNIMGGATFKGVTLKTGMEELGGDGTSSFKTPLGTNHKFQGWADKFLSTPNTGVRDVIASVSGKVAGTKLMFVYHNFHSTVGDISYGNEYDFLAVKKFGKHFKVLAKYAFYDADKHSVDTNKFWLQASVNF